MNAVLTTALKTFRQQASNFSLIAQKSESFGFCQNYFPEVLRSALQIKFYQKIPLVTWILFLTPLLKTSATNPEFLHSKSEKMSNIFLKKNTFVSKHFSGHMECGVDNSAKKSFAKKPAISRWLPKIQKVLVSAKNTSPKFSAPLDT